MPRPQRPPRRSRGASHAVLLAALLLAGSGCRDSRTVQGRAATVPPADERARFTSDAREVASSPPDVLFSHVTSLDLDSRGNIYVGDWNNRSVTVLSPSGKLLRVVGREGGGPGEFRSVSQVEVLPGDSLQVYDLQLGRLTVFEPGSDKVAYTLNLGGRNSLAFEIQRRHHSAGMLATYRLSFSPSDDPRQDAARVDVLRLLDPRGLVERDSVLVFPSPVMLVLRDAGRVAVSGDPFGRKGIARLGPNDRVYYAWTDSPTVRVFSITGDSLGAFTFPVDPPSVTAADLERAAGERNQSFRRVLAEAAPKRWPAMREMIVDRRGRIWIALTAPFGQPVEWAVLTDAGHYVGSVRLPPNAAIAAVRGTRLYGVATDDLDVPRVVVYELGRDPGRVAGAL